MAKEMVLDEEEFARLMGDAFGEEPDAARVEIFYDQLAKKSWGELEAVERGDHLLFPEKLWKRNKAGKFEVTPIMVQVPRMGDMRKARALAHVIAREDGIDPKFDSHLFDDLENVCIMAYAVRDATSPYSFMFARDKDTPDPRMLERKFDEGSLSHLWSRLAPYKQLLNPQLTRVTRDEFMAVIAAIAERRDIAPLLAIDGLARDSCIVTMACLLQSLMTRQSSSQSSESSTPEPSASPTPTPSSAASG